jgi:hypothetical protein
MLKHLVPFLCLWGVAGAVLLSPPTAELMDALSRNNTRNPNNKIHYLTFGHNCCVLSKARACAAAAPYVDECHALSMNDVDAQFRKEHAQTLNTPRGGGLWLWKPYLINRTLHSLQEGDYLLYMDAGAYLVGDIEPLRRMTDYYDGVLTFGVGFTQQQYCKRDAFVRQRCDTDACHKAMQVNGAYSMWRKSTHALRVVEAWLKDCTDHQSISDAPSQSGPPLEGFIDHRHDQALLTNVLVREGWPRDTTHGDVLYMVVHDRNLA